MTLKQQREGVGVMLADDAREGADVMVRGAAFDYCT